MRVTLRGVTHVTGDTHGALSPAWGHQGEVTPWGAWGGHPLGGGGTVRGCHPLGGCDAVREGLSPMGSVTPSRGCHPLRECDTKRGLSPTGRGDTEGGLSHVRGVTPRGGDTGVSPTAVPPVPTAGALAGRGDPGPHLQRPHPAQGQVTNLEGGGHRGGPTPPLIPIPAAPSPPHRFAAAPQ